MDSQGFDVMDQKLLLALIETFNGGPVGLETLAAFINEEKGTIEDVIEPFLIQQGFMMRTPRGRIATRHAYLHFGLKMPEKVYDVASGQRVRGRGMIGQEFVYPLRVHIEDTDCTGLVFHSNYLNFMERARSEWIDQLGMTIAWQKEHGIFFVVHSININFMKPARAHDRLEVVSKVLTLKRASIIFDQYLRLAGSADKILCRAEIKIACVDGNMKPTALPELPNLS